MVKSKDKLIERKTGKREYRVYLHKKRRISQQTKRWTQTTQLQLIDRIGKSKDREKGRKKEQIQCKTTQKKPNKEKDYSHPRKE